MILEIHNASICGFPTLQHLSVNLSNRIEVCIFLVSHQEALLSILRLNKHAFILSFPALQNFESIFNIFYCSFCFYSKYDQIKMFENGGIFLPSYTIIYILCIIYIYTYITTVERSNQKTRKIITSQAFITNDQIAFIFYSKLHLYEKKNHKIKILDAVGCTTYPFCVKLKRKGPICSYIPEGV